MAQNTSLEVECLDQLREYVKSLGGEITEEWKCRAQVRDYGARSGSVDTWFTAPNGDVFRSKIAAARGIGLDTSVGKNTKRVVSKSSRKPAADGGGGDDYDTNEYDEEEDEYEKDGGGGKDDASDKPPAPSTAPATAPLAPAAGGGGGKSRVDDSMKWATVSTTNNPKPVDLTMQEIGELLLSMPTATDVDDCYEGPLFYKEAQLRYATKMAARAAAAAAAAREAEELAAEVAAAEAASLAEAHARKEQEEEERMKMKAAADGEDVEMKNVDGEHAGDDGVKEGEHENMEERDEEEEKKEEEKKNRPGSRRNTRHSLAAAVAAAAAVLRAQSGTELPPGVAAMDGAGAGYFDASGGAFGLLGELSLPPPGPPQLSAWDVELEVIRKCFVRVPVRLGRSEEDEPVPLSPTSRHDPEITQGLLSLAAADGVNGGGGDNTNDMNDTTTVSQREGAASIAEWQLKRFPLDQLTANNGEPSALHPAALFYLRHLEEEIVAEERALRRDAEEKAARREAKRLEKAAALATGGIDGAPRIPLPKPANLSLRGKSIEEVEEALMERLSTYVSDLGGILPDGWRVKASIRQNGANAGGVDAYYYDPTGRRHKSMIKVAEILGLEATAAAKPKTLASILGTSGKRSRASATEEDPNSTVMVAPVAAAAADGGGGDGGDGAEEGQQQQLQQEQGDAVMTDAAVASPSPQQQNLTAAAAIGGGGGYERAMSPSVDMYGGFAADGGDDPSSSARKTCGVCRTCLNPQLKKGCLANKARKGDDPRSTTSKPKKVRVESSPSPTPPPPKKMTVRQLAKIERLKKEKSEKEAKAAALAAAMAAEEEEEEAAAARARAVVDADVQPVYEEEEEQQEQQPVFEEAPAPPASPPPAVEHEAVDDDEDEDIVIDHPLPQQQQQQQGSIPLQSAAEIDNTLDGGAVQNDNTVEEMESDLPAAAGVIEDDAVVEDDAPAAVVEDGGGDQKSGSGGANKSTDGKGGGTKRNHSEIVAAGGSGGGGDDDNDDDDADGRGKKPRRDDDEGDGHKAEGVPYPRRNRKQVKRQDPLEDVATTKKKKEAQKAARREKRKHQDNEIIRTVYDRAYNRLKGQLSRLRQEQALVEAYAADGWRGAAREKVKPVAEIKRAKEQIQRCKEVIRDCVRVCDEAEGDTSIPAELFDSDGELDLDHIFCAKCKGNESTDDNDIILCDGHCDRAYHVKCLVPPVDPATLPEDEGWLCPSCDRKIDMIDDINDEFGTEYEYDAPWQEVLAPGTFPASPPQAQNVGGGGGGSGAPVDLSRLEGLLAGADLPSDDEEDEDYSVSGSESEKEQGEEEEEEEKEKEEEAEEADQVEDDEDDDGSSSEGDSGFESEDLGAEILDVEITAEEAAALAERYAMATSSSSGGSEDEDSEAKLIVQGKRRRTAVDYQALNQEMFGDAETPVVDALVSEEEAEEEDDEVWSPKVQARKARQRKKEEEEDSDDGSDDKSGDGGGEGEEQEEEEEEEDAGEAEQKEGEQEQGGEEEGSGGGDVEMKTDE